MAKKRSRKKCSRLNNELLRWILLISLWLGVVFVTNLPQLQDLRDSVVYIVVTKAVITGVLLYLTYFRKSKKQPKGACVLLTGYALTPWLALVIPSDRVVLALHLAWMFASIGYQVYLNLKHRENTMLLLCTTAILSVLLVMSFSQAYVFPDTAAWDLPFWPVSVAVMALATAAAVYLVVKGYWYLKDDRTSEKVCLCILVAFVAFMITEFSLWHVNYIFDTSEPVTYELTVEEKDIYTHTKGGTDYILIGTLNGQRLEMDVSQSEYYHYELGDKLPVSYYEGFLGQPYYITE